MRLAELSERSGVPLATIKYYLREGLLAPGRRISATTAEYDEGHLRRLRLVRALIQVGRVPVATAREVLGHVDDDSLGRTIRLGAALWALPQVPEPDEEDENVRAAQHEVDQLLRTLDWTTAQNLSSISPAHRSLVVAVATLRRLGYAWDAELMAPYAQLMHQAAVRDLDFVETHPSEAEKVETAVAAAILFEPVLRALHRLAQEEESARRYGIE
ncbi:transcriptional regulator [Streptomyces avermitilis]|uniref:MerR-family transcriptional regulator n=2 Tax=Streptomyces avermitilis TaxID=33903 RepID=Q82JR5_STRAW|nr:MULTISPECIES: MerR family transcriptional regulator [Streptomyces]KUN51408.1 transcriptional regulator [Streptomyces avermitilis]MYS98290.1 MerR family transcriptional regulator [Streptomyces sp. SID5469]OOV33300.1 transcriptional regulator [Streptomyces avermitilis]BAC70400.1 putative MerR-family transcriptional regulator [Streptomyces avermitilis MA-4680 = NBRC 14893]BBJ50496.1 transcriptional regulator [Streptomyces avermitilis]